MPLRAKRKPRRIKIVCDGHPATVRILDAETGEDLRFPIAKISWTLEAGDFAYVTIEAAIVHADLLGELRTVSVPTSDVDRGRERK